MASFEVTKRTLCMLAAMALSESSLLDQNLLIVNPFLTKDFLNMEFVFKYGIWEFLIHF